jgi:mono/diheme cytochrome c family protein
MRNLLALATLFALASTPCAAAPAKKDPALERGRYLVKIGGCNDCHTEGYAEKAGAVAESAWLTGAKVGFQGPWGTTYPTNLRQRFADLSEAQWLVIARKPMRPPMPWFNLRDMTDADLKAMYRFVRSLGRAGDAAPEYVPPGGKAVAPYAVLVPPVMPPK